MYCNKAVPQCSHVSRVRSGMMPSTPSRTLVGRRRPPGDCGRLMTRCHATGDLTSLRKWAQEWSGAEATCARRVCVVYGALPPEMRRTQARLFNDPDSGYDILVASDAVGMGLNLNIRRIIFHTLSKFENGHRVPISISQIKQIGGALPAPPFPSSGTVLISHHEHASKPSV